MAYSRSSALADWLTVRRSVIDTLRSAHASVSKVGGAGRPLEAGRPVAHAYVLVVAAEFQGFLRDLHDLAVDHLVLRSGMDPAYASLMTTGLKSGRGIDRGNATVTTVQADFRRIGVLRLNDSLRQRQPRWNPPGAHGDRTIYESLIELRNALAHGNRQQLADLRSTDVRDTISWTSGCLPGLNRTARAVDRLVWDHLTHSTKKAPW